MRCYKCDGEVIVLRYRKGTKRISTTYKCKNCGRLCTAWEEVSNG